MDHFKNTPPTTERLIPKPEVPFEKTGRDYLKAWHEAYTNSNKYTEHWDEKKELKTLGGKIVDLIPVEVGHDLDHMVVADNLSVDVEDGMVLSDHLVPANAAAQLLDF